MRADLVTTEFPKAAAYFTAHDLLIGLVWGAVSLTLLLGYMTKHHRYDQESVIHFGLAYLFFLGFILISPFISLLPTFPDTALFVEIIKLDGATHPSLGVILYQYVSAPLRILAWNGVFAFLVLQGTLYLCAALILWRAWQLYCKEKSIVTGRFSGFIWLVVVYPSALLFITIPLREFLLIFAISIFMLGLAKNINGNGWWLIFVGVVLSVCVRPQLILVFPIFFVVYKFFFNRTTPIRWFAIILALPIAGGIAIALFGALTGYPITPEFFAGVRAAAFERYGESGMVYGGDFAWTSFLEMALSLPLLFLQFILAPLPILHSNPPLQMKALVLDLLYCLPIYLAAIVMFKQARGIVMMVLAGLVLFSLWEFYIGGAVRHRFPLLFVLIPLVSAMLTRVVWVNQESDLKRD